jgi:hypothetical protein
MGEKEGPRASRAVSSGGAAESATQEHRPEQQPNKKEQGKPKL